MFYYTDQKENKTNLILFSVFTTHKYKNETKKFYFFCRV